MPTKKASQTPKKAESIAAARVATLDCPPYDEEALKLTGTDLDRFADYFGSCFEFNTEPITVLLALLQRLRATAEANRSGSNMVAVEDVIHSLSQRLFIKCMAGLLNASRKNLATKLS